jgi:hypothetical protein
VAVLPHPNIKSPNMFPETQTESAATQYSRV